MKPKVKLRWCTEYEGEVYAVIPSTELHVFPWLNGYVFKIGQVRP